MWGSDNKVGHYDTILSNKTEMIGDIKVVGGLHVDGVVKGNILAEEGSNAVVRISEKGLVEGEIRAPKIIINGTVKGDVFSSDHIELAQKASVTGDVHYVMMEMVMGAKVNGKLLHRADVKGKRKLIGGSKDSSSSSEDTKPVTETKPAGTSHT
jgi:cytoskeletal protein CcmA (bactofilin family)